MSNSQAELLIDHYDNQLLGKGSPEVTQLIGDDSETAGDGAILILRSTPYATPRCMKR